MSKKISVTIIGSGSWGFALALALNRSSTNVKVLFKNPKKASKVRLIRKSTYLPFVKIPQTIKIISNYDEIKDSNYIFLAIPSQSLRNVLKNFKDIKNYNYNFVICSKGIEKITNKLMSEVLLEIFPKTVPIVLSGPNFADEVARDLPTAFVLSGEKEETLMKLGDLISTPNFRPYFNTDIIGTQIGGVLKNIISIACGIMVGKKLGENAKASILSRGLNEMVSLGTKLGAKKETFMGLSGLGDLALSCNSNKSRNMKFGLRLGQGEFLEDILNNSPLVEGVNCCESVQELSRQKKIELPICNTISNIINGKSIDDEIMSLISRPLQFEK